MHSGYILKDYSEKVKRPAGFRQGAVREKTPDRETGRAWADMHLGRGSEPDLLAGLAPLPELRDGGE